MTFSLSFGRLTETVHALAALEMLTAPDSYRLILAPLFDRERPEALGRLILDSFASLLLEILPYVESADTDTLSALGSYAPALSSGLFSLDLRLPAGCREAASGVILRNLELAVAAGVLESAFLADTASDLAEKFAASRSAAVATLLATLQTPPAPFVRNRGF